jgi:transposase-like protein
VQHIVSDDYAGLKDAPRMARFGDVAWQRCLFHFA